MSGPSVEEVAKGWALVGQFATEWNKGTEAYAPKMRAKRKPLHPPLVPAPRCVERTLPGRGRVRTEVRPCDWMKAQRQVLGISRREHDRLRNLARQAG